MTPSLLVDG